MPVDLSAALADDGAGSGVPFGAELLALTEAVLGDDPGLIVPCREAVRRVLGDDGLADTAATIASYNAVVKVADAAGIELEDETAAMTADLRADLGIFDSKT